MSIQSPLFEGRRVKHVELAITGRSDGQGHVRHIGDEVTVLVVGTITKVAHADSDEGLVRTHTLKVSEAHQLEAGEASTLLVDAREKDSRFLDELLGRRSLFDDGDGGVDPETGEIP